MAEEEDKESKTEEPTEKKIKDAVEKGQTPVSREIPILVSLFLFTCYFIFAGQQIAFDSSQFLKGMIEQSAQIPISTDLDATNLMGLVSQKFLHIIIPVCLVLMAGGILASALQNEPRMVLNRIAPKLSKISLKKGWGRLFGKQGVAEFAKSLAKLGFAGAVVGIVLYTSPEELLNGMFLDPVAFSSITSDIIQRMLLAVCFAMALVAAADFMWQRYSWRENLRMTRKEVTDELKQAEGDPIVKARMRSIARDRSRQRMMEAVPTATLVIANPTHISIALRFDADKDEAPVVVAKGQDLIALKIREIAKESGIPVFERIELARALNKVVEVNQIIPPDFYAAVAELINIIYRKNSELAR